MSSRSSEHLNKYFVPEKGVLKDVLIRAGAGAGKTTELVKRVISLALVQHKETGKWPKLVVTTFTRKATQELRERLLQAGLAIGDEGLLQYLQSSQSLHISTIHGILTVYLKRYGRAMELSPDFQIMESRQQQRLTRKTLRMLLKEDSDFSTDFQALLEETDLKTLEAAVQEWSTLQVDEPVNQRQQLSDFQKEWDEETAVAVKAAKELAHEMEALTLNEGWSNWLSALKGFANPARDLRERVQFFNENPGGVLRGNKNLPEDLPARVRDLKEKIQELSLYPSQEQYWQLHEDLSIRFERLAKKWSDRVREEKIRSSKLSMEDLELFAMLLTQKFPETAERFSSEWDYWLIDEYQDTSPRQVKLIQSLTQKKKVFLVGDPQQSIYLFRGARAEVFAEAEEAVRSKKGDLFELMTNYRTSAPVLEFMNDLFVKVSSQLSPMTVGKRDDQPVATPVYLWQVPEKKRSEGLQVEATLQRIQELLQQGASAETICVLSRKRRDLGAIAARATELGIPCQLHAAGLFYERREIQDALAILKFLVTPEDNENLVAMLRSPWFALTDEQILRFCHKEAVSFWNTLRALKNDPAFAPTVTLLQFSIDDLHIRGVAHVWRELLIKQGFFDVALRLDPSGRREANLWKLVQNLFAQENKPGFRYGDFLQQPDLADTEEAGQGDASPVVEPKRVQLMTVHASKGLQFPHVIVPYLNDFAVSLDRTFFAWNENKKIWGLCLRDPDDFKRLGSKICEEAFELQKQRGLEELHRLYYVALTRAQNSLSLIWGKPDEKSWAHHLSQQSFVDHLPEPVQFTLEEGASSQVRKPYEHKREVGALRQGLSVTAVLDTDEKLTVRSSSSSHESWKKLWKANRGTQVHRLMESLKYDPTRKLSTPEFQPVLDFLDQEASFLKELIASGDVEWGFEIQVKDRLLKGQIDLWGRDAKGGAWVVDYKTGSPDHADKALRQLEIYTWALRKLGKIKEDEMVRLAAVFPFHSKIVEEVAPTQAITERALLARIESLT